MVTYAEKLVRKEKKRQQQAFPSGLQLQMSVQLAAALRAQLEDATRIKFPSPLFRRDPVKFFELVLGVEPWSKQREIIEAIRDNQRVAVKSGHKVSKSHTLAGVALWYYCSFEDARVVCSSTTSRQVNKIIWRELRMMRARSGRCLDCRKMQEDGPRPCVHSALIDGELGETAQTGLKSTDFREVVGFTATEAEAVAGISGANLLYLLDEASGIDDAIFEAIEGNRAGGARVVMFSNPTRTTGEFFDAFNSKARFYKTITVSSEETPNVVEGRVVIPGLATREWIEEKKEEWGEESPLYKVRVKGEFPLKEDGKIFSIHTISQAEKKWEETSEAGRLFIGIDPAGPTGSGDESVFCLRRGLKVMHLQPNLGLNDEGHLVTLLGLLKQWGLPGEIPVVVLDREGSIGASLFGMLRNHSELHPEAFELVGARASDRAPRQPLVYDRLRDELASSLESWFREGGAIPTDSKLAQELHVFEWKQQANGRLKVTSKEDVKKIIGRSPDRYDALALSCWVPLLLQENVPESAKKVVQRDAYERDESFDPYAGASAFHPR